MLLLPATWQVIHLENTGPRVVLHIWQLKALKIEPLKGLGSGGHEEGLGSGGHEDHLIKRVLWRSCQPTAPKSCGVCPAPFLSLGFQDCFCCL